MLWQVSVLDVSDADKCWWELKLKQQKAEQQEKKIQMIALQKQELRAKQQKLADAKLKKRLAERLAEGEKQEKLKKEKLDRQHRQHRLWHCCTLMLETRLECADCRCICISVCMYECMYVCM